MRGSDGGVTVRGVGGTIAAPDIRGGGVGGGTGIGPDAGGTASDGSDGNGRAPARAASGFASGAPTFPEASSWLATASEVTRPGADAARAAYRRRARRRRE